MQLANLHNHSTEQTLLDRKIGGRDNPEREKSLPLDASADSIFRHGATEEHKNINVKQIGLKSPKGNLNLKVNRIRVTK